MNPKEFRGVYQDDTENIGPDGEFIVVTEKDLRTVFQCKDCEALHANLADAEACCKEETE